jgi:hypothetical protein
LIIGNENVDHLEAGHRAEGRATDFCVIRKNHDALGAFEAPGKLFCRNPAPPLLR